jgi:DNA-binding transcriptional MerR regulator
MVRKRDRWTRAKDLGHRRPKVPAPKTGWLLTELATITGLSVTTLRYYVQQHLLRPAEFRGTLTRYQRPELLRLLGIVRLKSEGKSTLAEKQRRLDSMSAGELEKWLSSGPLVPAAAAALGLQVLTPAAASDPVALAATPGISIDLGSAPNEFWQRIALLPGLELLVRADAPQAARSAAQRICDEYVVK